MPFSAKTRQERRPRPPLDEAQLRALALFYVGRFATTEMRLTRYLARKIKERGWVDAEPIDLAELVTEFAAMGYVDDIQYAQSKAGSLYRRGYGPMRVKAVLSQAGIAADEVSRQSAIDDDAALAAATDFARRKKLGGAIDAPSDRKLHDKAIAKMMRAGHRYDIAKRALLLVATGAENIDM
jgi:regulatory protein